MDEFSFTYAGATRDVMVTGDKGPGVVLMHELTGMSPDCLSLAGYLAKKDLRVFLPLFFGRPGQKSWPPRPRAVQNILPGVPQLLCVRREFTMLASDRDSPITEWLRALCREVSGRTDDGKVGVIGMCLSGGFVFSLVIEPAVGAAVTSQPAMPWRIGASTIGPDELGTSESCMGDAVRRPVPVMGLRFRDDALSPSARFTEITSLYCEAGVGTRFDATEFAGSFHSVLTGEFDQAPGARELVANFLQNNLVGAPGNGE